MEKKDWETDWGRWRGGIKDGNEYFERDISEDFILHQDKTENIKQVLKQYSHEMTEKN